jgi:hypothetical protein
MQRLMSRRKEQRMKLKNFFVSLTQGMALLSVVSTFLWAVPAFALTITQNVNIAAGQAAFGPAVTLFNWTGFFPAGTTWSFGAIDPQNGGGTGTDPVTGNTVTANFSSSIHLGNWIDGDGFNPNGVGFNASNGAAAPDLGIDNAEDFSLQFTNPIREVGVAIATGISNVPGETDHLGAVFQVTTNTGDQGTLTLVDAGLGYTAWVTIASNTPFQTLTFFEPSGNIEDQYFGNILTSVTPVPTVPEPGSFVLLFLGVAGLAGWRHTRWQSRL